MCAHASHMHMPHMYIQARPVYIAHTVLSSVVHLSLQQSAKQCLLWRYRREFLADKPVDIVHWRSVRAWKLCYKSLLFANSRKFAKFVKLKTYKNLALDDIWWALCLFYLTIAHKVSRIWGPVTIYWYSIWWHTSSIHSTSWNKPRVAPEDYLHCVDVLNHTIFRGTSHPTVNWKEKVAYINQSIIKLKTTFSTCTF